MREFYAILIGDDIAAPCAIMALGDSAKNDKRHEHFKTLDHFWPIVMNGEPGYMDDPFVPHSSIRGLYPELLSESGCQPSYRYGLQ